MWSDLSEVLQGAFMVQGLVDLPIVLTRGAPPGGDTDLIADAARIAADLSAERGPERIPGLVTSSGAIALDFLTAAEPYVSAKNPSFCEWGSGLGIVTCLARRLGWNATGVEIEPRLIDMSRNLAACHRVDVAFHQCSYKPDVLFEPGSAPEDFDTGLGFGLFDFDVIYAYLWPAERDAVTAAIGRYARDGTIFLRYGGGVTCDAFRVSRPAQGDGARSELHNRRLTP